MGSTTFQKQNVNIPWDVRTNDLVSPSACGPQHIFTFVILSGRFVIKLSISDLNASEFIGNSWQNTHESKSVKSENVQNDKKVKKTTPFSNVCTELFNTINERSKNPSEKSYTNHLLTKGSNTILKKIGEESAEFIMACKDNDKNSISNEAADLIYHLQVALMHKGIEWRDVLTVLESRKKN